jgi:hypothetical protein
MADEAGAKVGADGAAAGGAETRIPVTVTTGIQPGPDGKAWVWVELSLSACAFKMVVPEATARDLVKLIPGLILEGAAGARRANLGLTVTSQMPAGPLGPLGMPINGRPPGA